MATTALKRTRRLGAIAGSVVLLAACRAAPARSPPSTGATRSPVSTSAPASPTVPVPSPPNARDVDPARFLRPHTSLDSVTIAELDGAPPREIVVGSVADEGGGGGAPPQQYLDAYAWTATTGSWDQVFDATEYPNPHGVTPGTMLLTGGDIHQIVPFVDALDLDGDGAAELVAGVLTVGASTGPLEVWLLSSPGGAEQFTTRFTEATTSGGDLSIGDDRASIVLVTGKYRDGDPHCCPSRIETQVIAYDAAQGKIRIVDRHLEPAPTP